MSSCGHSARAASADLAESTSPTFSFLFIYGPPAVGKLTVARAVVAARPAFKLFHNHVVVDAVAPLFPFGDPTFFDLVGRLRRELLEEAVKHELDVVMTYAYAREDEAAVTRYFEMVRRGGGEVFGVQLVAPPDVLATRVGAPSRRDYGKLDEASALREVLARWDFSRQVPDAPTLTIDTTLLDAHDAASQIVDHYRL